LVDTIERDSCSGCFQSNPTSQRQSDIVNVKKVIVCEHCGRILVDETLTMAEDIKILQRYNWKEIIIKRPLLEI
jgi:DNA-directed RNA polymerase subunit RPC12/RpoP